MRIRKTNVYKRWIKKLKDTKAKYRIFARISRLEEGNRGDWGPVGNNLFELRINYGPGYRVYCKDTGVEIIILLCGGDKATQQEDIARAQKIVLEPLDEAEEGNGKDNRK
ncbi:type II toxin-antitoxin system RelE/ParE family toxin [Treponema primitia]|uniref:type II toxin-antitoxin system RelE/ParE family toxin n=1 Tax=Treponema primitia TaxID=88058 RepID=UPI00398098EA